MTFKLRKIGSISYPGAKAKTLVIGSDNASLRLAYRHLVEETLKITEYFFYRNKGVIDSLAYNSNRDRPHSIDMIKKNLDRGVDHILVITHVDYADCKDRNTQRRKRDQKITAVQKALSLIKTHFRTDHQRLKLDAYIISICETEKVFHKIYIPKP